MNRLNESLKDRFPRIFAIAQEKCIFVEAIYGNGRMDGVWSVDVVRNLNDWEVGEYEDLLHLVSDVHVTTKRDQVVWKRKKNR